MRGRKTSGTWEQKTNQAVNKAVNRCNKPIFVS